MDVELSLLGWLAIVLPLSSTIVFFVLGKDLALARRLFASVHGLGAVAILPLIVIITARMPDISETGGTIIMLLLGGVAGTSIFYSLAVVRTRWFFHLLHVPTVAVIAASFVFALFLLSGR